MLRLLSLLSCFCLIFHASAQVADCNNIGFEQGNLRAWRLSNGFVVEQPDQTSFQWEVNGTYRDGHLLMRDDQGSDPLVVFQNMPVVPPGSKYSIKIGNSDAGARFDRITTSIVVGEDNTLFQYKFAIVLQDPNHSVANQPAFSIRVFSKNNTDIPCSYYQVSASNGIPGFINQPLVGYDPITFRNWTTGAIDLRKYIGQTVTIQVTTNDCAQGQHFGYAYFDAQCVKGEIVASESCPVEGSDLTLSAPDGFEKYRWSTGETSRQITVRAEPGKAYFVKVKPFSTLNESCEFQFDYKAPSPGLISLNEVTICEGDSLKVGVSVFKEAGTYLTAISIPGKCDSLVRTTLKVAPNPRFTENVTLCAGEIYSIGNKSYTTSGRYFTRFRRLNGCDSIVTTNLIIRPEVIYTQSITICEGEIFVVDHDNYGNSGTYTNIIRRIDNCDSTVITTLHVIKLDLSLESQIFLDLGDSVQLQPRIQPPGQYIYDWSPKGETSCDSCSDPWVKPIRSMVFTLKIENEDRYCKTTKKTYIGIKPCTVHMPNVFTPNGDGLNDYFHPIAQKCVQRILLFSILNRWGEIVFRQEDLVPSDEKLRWDGRYNGLYAPIDYYSYEVVVLQGDGDTVAMKGSVLIAK